MLRKILLAVVVLVALFAVYVSTRPSRYEVQRSVVVNAPAEAPYALVNDFHQWAKWSPWEHLDPAMQKTYTGSPTGTGSSYAWTGNDKVGAGTMLITQTQPPRLIDVDLNFLKPFKSSSKTEFRFEPAATGTTVTWSMTGESNFVSKAMQVFMSMDKMIGGDFERGLGALKTAAEANAAAQKAAVQAAAESPAAADAGTK